MNTEIDREIDNHLNKLPIDTLKKIKDTIAILEEHIPFTPLIHLSIGDIKNKVVLILWERS